MAHDCCDYGEICLCGAQVDPRSRLAFLMSEISEDCYCAGWLIGTEHALWEIANGGGGGWGIDTVTAEQAAQLLALSAEIGGWIAWSHDRDPGSNGPIFVPMTEWLKRHETSEYVGWMDSEGIARAVPETGGRET